MTVRSMALLVLISVAYFVLARQTVGVPESGDLRALWLAGKYYPTGEIGSVYRLYDGVFSMAPPEVWIDDVNSQGLETPVYPFIYPPLWAWVMSWVVPLTTMDEFGRIMGIVNPCLMILSALLAMRIAAPEMPRPFYFGVALAVSVTSFLFLLPLAENQPQVLVSFLVLLGIERARTGSALAGGLALALAASIKLYPVIFALVWLAAGDRRSVLYFALFGGLLGFMSLLVAGWPMHAAFLSELSAISKTALVSRANFSLDPLIAILTVPVQEMSSANTYATGGETNWHYIAKSDAMRLASALIQLATLSVLLVLARRSRMQDPLLWPFLMIAVAWVSPLSWIYHYMAPLLFLPSLIDRLGVSRGILLIALITAPTQIGLLIADITSELDKYTTSLLNNGALLLAGTLFLWLALRQKPPQRF